MIYYNSGLTPGQVVNTPDGLGAVSSITTDGCSTFLLASGKSIFALDFRGKFRRIIDAGSRHLIDIDVVQSELWLFYHEESVFTVMTSAKESWKHGQEPGEGMLVLTQEYVYDVFVAYSSCEKEERKWVNLILTPKLENEHGLKLCIHHRDFTPGQDLAENIIQAINKSEKTLFILSPSFLNSDWCHFEVIMACEKMISEKRDSLIIVVFKGLDRIQPQMPTMLSRLIQKNLYIEWTDDSNQQILFWRKLVYTISCPRYDAFNHDVGVYEEGSVVTVMTPAKVSLRHGHRPGQGMPVLTQKYVYDVFVA